MLLPDLVAASGKIQKGLSKLGAMSAQPALRRTEAKAFFGEEPDWGFGRCASREVEAGVASVPAVS